MENGTVFFFFFYYNKGKERYVCISTALYTAFFFWEYVFSLFFSFLTYCVACFNLRGWFLDGSVVFD